MNFRFVVGDLVRINPHADFGGGSTGQVTTIEYIPDFGDAEYMVMFDEPVPNPLYNPADGEWEEPTFLDGYFTDSELEPLALVPKKRTSGFGRFINRIEDV